MISDCSGAGKVPEFGAKVIMVQTMEEGKTDADNTPFSKPRQSQSTFDSTGAWVLAARPLPSKRH